MSRAQDMATIRPKGILNQYDRAAALKHAEGIIAKAQAEGRNDLTDAEAQTLDDINTAVKTYDERRKVAGPFLSQFPLADPLESAKGARIWEDDNDVPTIAGIFTTKQAQDFAAAFTDAKVFKTELAPLVKAPLAGIGADRYLAAAALLPAAKAGFPLAALMLQETALSPNVRTTRIGTGTAAIVAEGALKPDANVDVTSIDVAVKKIAAHFTITTESRDDVPGTIEAVGQQVIKAVVSKENDEIVAAWNGASGALTANATAATLVDDIATAIGMSESANGQTPTAIVVNPIDLAVIRKAKASGSSEYVIDPQQPHGTTLFGVPVISSPAVQARVATTTPGKVYILTGTDHAVMYRRTPLELKTGFNGEDFVYNRVTTIVEERVVPVVIKPTQLTVVTIAA